MTFRAPWSTSLKVMSIGVTVLLTGIPVVEAALLDEAALGAWSAISFFLLPLLILVACALFTIRGYRLSEGDLEVQRLLWSTNVPLGSLQRAWSSPDAMSGSIRLFGNGGAFSMSGLFRNRELGRYRAFATSPKNAVVLELAERKVVVTPESPAELLDFLELQHPGVRDSPR